MAEEIPLTQGGGQGPATPAPKMSFEEYKAKLNASIGQEQDEEGPQPVESFWQRLLHGAPGKSRWVETARSMARGTSNAVNETLKTAGEIATFTPGSQQFSTLGNVQIPTDALLGKRSDDPIASFSEDVTQFVAPFAVTGAAGVELKLARMFGLGRTAAIASGAAVRGAAVDAVAFDPRQGGLAELAARAPVPILKQLGEILSVTDDDSQAVARLKRSVAGVIPGVTIDGLVAGVRWARAAKAGDKPMMEIQANVINDIAEGTHTPEGAHVVVRPTPGGEWEIKTNVNSKAVADMPDSPKFADRAEAEAQAESMNEAINQRERASAPPLTPEQTKQTADTFRRILDNPTAEEIAGLTDGTHFNFSYYQEDKALLATIESLSQVFKAEIDAAQKSGGVSVQKHFAMAQELISGIPADIRGPWLAEQLEMGGSQIPRSVVQTAADLVMRQSAQEVSKLFDIITARPQDAVAFDELRAALGSMLKLQKSLAEAESEWGRTGRFMQEKDAFAQAARDGTTPVSAKNVKEAPPIDLPDVAGMKRRDVELLARMVKMAGGKPANLFAVARGARVIKETGVLRKSLEVFANSLLSGLAIPTALTMNTVESVYRAGSKMLAGGLTANPAQFREGADILYGTVAYLKDNFKSAAASFRVGRSIINPQDTHVAIDGALGEAIRLPSRGLLFADELTRVTNYRAYVRARSLRFWREKGLEGPALYGNVERDLQAAFDPRTGMATIPEGMTYAEGPTMSAPLGKETLGGKMADFLNNTVEAKFVAPFVKTSINIFRMTWDRTPALNMFNARARDVLLGRSGKEAAAELWTQTGLAGGMYVFGYMKAKAGDVTGRGPSDPQLRKLWLEDHKPYSIKVNGEWISYRRGDPLFAPLSIAADLSLIMDEAGASGHGDQDASDVATAFVASLAASFANKTYMTGVTQFFEAWSGGSGDAMKQWLHGMGTAFIPQGVSVVNQDPYLREVDSFKDAVMAKIPGLSEHLPARYNLFGEPIYRHPSISPFPSKGDAKETVATDLLKLGRGFAALPRTAGDGHVDLTDRAAFSNGSGVSPYERMQELLREPQHGRAPLKDALTELVKSDKWKSASEGSDLYPGGQRWMLAAHLIDGYQQRAHSQTLREFPKLKDALKLERRIKGASVSKGQDAVNQLTAALR